LNPLKGVGTTSSIASFFASWQILTKIKRKLQKVEKHFYVSVSGPAK
jgi:hypothetical protein